VGGGDAHGTRAAADAGGRGRGRNITGAEYVRLLSAQASDVRAREAFRAHALRLSAPGQRLYDFGAGPGLDARYYAAEGRRVEAYDIDPEMCAYFSEYCADLIAGGQVRLHPASFPQFLANPPRAPAEQVDLITANFAPLNLVEDLEALFAAFAALARPGAYVLASVLGPYHLRDLRYGWWWGNLPRFLAQGRYAVEGAQARIWRRSLREYAARSAPHFSLERVFRDALPEAGTGDCPGLDPRSPLAFAHLATARFMFLLLRRA
jgi:SAM-dependent methyltransferase